MSRIPRVLAAAVVVVTLALITSGTLFCRAQERLLRQQVEGRLAAIARLKVDQIAAWRTRRLDGGAELVEQPVLGRRIARWLVNPRVGDREALLAEFRVLQRHDDYADVLLVDENGRVCLSLSGRSRTHENVAQVLAAALRDGRPALTELHTEVDDPRPKIAVVAPLFAGDGQAPRPLGAVILVTDARQFLYPLIQSWPMPSKTAETLLVRRDGDHALFLNDLRHRADTALKLRIPLSRTEVPAVMAVLGKEGVVEGVDYRGVDVVSVLQVIPNSAWFMVAKVDAAEAFAGWHSRSAFILVLLLGLVVLTGVIGLVVWERREKAHYRDLFEAEAARRQSEERHRITLMSVGDGVIATDAEGRVEVINPVAKTLTGWATEDVRGKPVGEVFRIVNEDTRQPMESPVSRVLREGRVAGLANHTVLLAKEGTERPIADSAAPIRDEQGAITGVVLVFRDQTEERAAQKALMVSESRYRRLFETAKDGILILDADSGLIVDVNPFLVDLLGYSFESFRGKELWEIGLFKDIMASKAMVRELQGVGYIRYESLPLKTRDGRPIEVEFVSNVYRADGARVIQCNIRDITDRKRAEESLQESEAQFRAMFETASIGMAQADVRTGQFLRVNDKLCAITGYAAEELLRLHVPEITHPEDREQDWQLFERVVRGDAPDYRMEKRYVRKDGRLVWVNVNMTVIRGADGQPLRTMAAIEDIADRKRLEQERIELEAQLRQQQKLEALGTLAGGVAHEINNPIAGIMNYAQLIVDTVTPESRAAEYAGEIVHETERVATIVRNLLQFARQESQAHSFARIADIVEQTLSLCRAVLRRDQITLTVDVPDDLPALKCRSQQIQQVLMNLLTNARDALNAKYPGYHADKTIRVSARPFEQAGRPWLRLTVADQGTGISPEVQARIFDPFFTTKPRDKGSGLGLSISHGIVQGHHGVLHFETTPGTGTQFHLDLPVEEEE